MRMIQLAFNRIPESHPMVYVDVGAYCGDIAKQCLHQFGSSRVLAVEPCPVNFKILQKRFGKNPFVTLDNHMVGSKDATQTMYCIDIKGLDGSSKSNTIYEDVLKKKRKIRPDMGKIKKRSVESITMDTLFEYHSIKHADVVKFNCEGGEYAVFEAETFDWLTRVDYIAIDMHSDNSFYHTREFIDRRRGIYKRMLDSNFVLIAGDAEMDSKKDVSILMKKG